MVELPLGTVDLHGLTRVAIEHTVVLDSPRHHQLESVADFAAVCCVQPVQGMQELADVDAVLAVEEVIEFSVVLEAENGGLGVHDEGNHNEEHEFGLVPVAEESVHQA